MLERQSAATRRFADLPNLLEWQLATTCDVGATICRDQTTRERTVMPMWLRRIIAGVAKGVVLWALASLLGCAQGTLPVLRSESPTPTPLGTTPTFRPPKEGGRPMQRQRLRIYVGTYTHRGSKGIYAFELDLTTGATTEPTLVAETVNPSFLALHPSHRFLYAVNEVGEFQGERTGSVSAFAVDPSTGKLTLLNQQPSKGTAPCHLTVDKQGKCVLVANYGSGSVAVLPILPDGRLGEPTAVIQHEGKSVNPQRQEGPHAHSVNLDAANRFAFVADLGLDKVLIYRFDGNKGTLTPNDPPFAAVASGAGPRHFAFHPNGRFAYVINELNSTITAFRYDAQKGTLSELQTVSTLPDNFKGDNWTAEVQVHPSGKFLYGSNRGHNSIAIFAIDAQGHLQPIGHEPTQGKMPRHFAIDPTGTFLLAANQDTDNLVVFRIDPKTGKLQPTGQQVSIPTPVCVLPVPSP